jgi:hypothetical protein
MSDKSDYEQFKDMLDALGASYVEECVMDKEEGPSFVLIVYKDDKRVTDVYFDTGTRSFVNMSNLIC